MNKSQLIKKISKELNLDTTKVKELLECILDSIIEVLIEEKRIELRNFGVLKLKKLKGTFVKNPKNGVEMFVGERYTVRFKPSKKLIEMINEKDQV
ncbi:HU family DNA-binding protein [Thermocrinis jamiesonii]|jgi:Bacterial nucleoid DNA-binding protein|uniref:HU family DNA-binding protein n=1 Tax=Thermocrinis jamiesonii TaxID=1302351 RepID=UPI000495FA8E|nr:HU family DNA-binding protein [Thermocrinis jamiesonii]